MKQIDFNELKRRISLPEFLEELGWKHVRGSTRLNPKMKNPEGGETIVIKKNRLGFHTYFDIHNEGVQGSSILDFMQKYLSFKRGHSVSLYEAGKVLQEYVDSGKAIDPGKSSFFILAETNIENSVADKIKSLVPLHTTNDHSFLEERGINKDMLRRLTWRSTFFEHWVLDTESKTSYKNICVKLYNSKGVQGFSQRNTLFKGAIGIRYNTIAVSKFDNKQCIDNIFIGESMLDCISYDQMHIEDHADQNNLFISTEGAITNGQIDTIHQVFIKNPHKNIVLLFDNDLEGQLYGLKLLGGNQTIPYQVVVSKCSGIITIIGKSEIYPLFSIFPEEVQAKEINPFELLFPSTKESVINITKRIGELLFKDTFRIDLPIDGDFNDDLRKTLLEDK